MNWLTFFASILGALMTGTGAAAIWTGVFRRPVTKVEATERLYESTLEWAEQLKADTTDARHEAAEARREAGDARGGATAAHREMGAIKVEAEELAGFLTQMVRWIHSPDMSIERLGVLVAQAGPMNGSAR